MPPRPQDFWLDHLGQAHRFNDWVFSHVRPHLRGRVLEVGCGSGNFTVLVAADGHDVTGCDIDPAYVAAAAARLAPYPAARAVLADATSADFTAGYDTILLLDVLEHIEDHIDLLRRLRARLAPGGTLILKVPALAWLYCEMDAAIGHYRRYSRRALRAALEEAGFSCVRQRHFNAAAIAGWFLNGRVLRRTTPPGEQIAAFERLVPVLRAVEGVLPVPVGISLIATAKG